MPLTASALVRQTNQRSRNEILAAIGDSTLSTTMEKKALVSTVLEFVPLRFMIDRLKAIPVCRRLLVSWLPAKIKYRGVYSSFDEARGHAPKNIPLGYDHDEIALGYKNQKFLSSDYPAAFWLREALQDEPTVLDLGGSVGISFYNWEQYFKYPEDLQWVVCEVPAVTLAGDKIASERKEERLHFVSRIEAADGCNCLLASGSLQYMDGSLTDLLKQLQQQPRHLIINRIPLHSQRQCITLQNVRWAVSPYRVFQRDAFVSALEAFGYTLIDAWSVLDHDCWIPFYPEFSVPTYSGLYFRKHQDRDR
jgi:putative methyltransferase (TIGR04325 family)